MSFLILAAALAAAPTPLHSEDAMLRQRACLMQPLERTYIQAPQRPQRMGDLPRADLHLPVYRVVDGCDVPVIKVRDVEGRLQGR